MSVVRMLMLVALLCPRDAAAEPWHRGKHGARRVVHLSITIGAGGLFVLTEGALKRSLAPATCRWCDPPGIDEDVRARLVWDDTEQGAIVGTVTGYVLAPAAALGFTLFAINREAEATSARVIDDMLPIVETVAVSQVILQVVKFSAGRARPYAHFTPRGLADPDDNLSFFSGHTALAFGVATSAGVVAHRRGYATEPYVWSVGMALAASTAYLRIAADRHYFTDVAFGAAWGTAAGVVVPLSWGDVAIVPTANGAVATGTF